MAEIRKFNAIIVLETTKLVQDAAHLLTKQGYELDTDYEFYYQGNWELIGLRTANPKVAQIVLAFS